MKNHVGSNFGFVGYEISVESIQLSFIQTPREFKLFKLSGYVFKIFKRNQIKANPSLSNFEKLSEIFFQNSLDYVVSLSLQHSTGFIFKACMT